MPCHRILKNSGQPVGAESLGGGFVCAVHRLIQVAHTGAVQCRNKMDVRIVDELQAALELAANPLFLVAIDAVPLIECNHQATTRVDTLSQQVQILLHDPLVGIHDQNHNIGIGDRFKGFDNGKLLHHLTDIFAASNARGINQRVVFAVSLVFDIDTVAGRAGLVIYHHAVFAEHAIDQCRLTDIRPTNNRNTNAAIVGFQLFHRRQWRDDIFEQTLHAAVVRGRNRVHFSDAE
jgi:hypothetical protein